MSQTSTHLRVWRGWRLDTLRGRWEVGQMPGNDAAHDFWLRVIGRYTQGRFTDQALADQRWRGWLQCFDNRLPPTGAPGTA